MEKGKYIFNSNGNKSSAVIARDIPRLKLLSLQAQGGGINKVQLSIFILELRAHTMQTLYPGLELIFDKVEPRYPVIQAPGDTSRKSMAPVGNQRAWERYEHQNILLNDDINILFKIIYDQLDVSIIDAVK